MQGFLCTLGKTINFTDGRTAIIDKTDAKKLAQHGGTERAAEISQLDEIIKSSKATGEPVKVIHDKFDHFIYYLAKVDIDGAIHPIFLNVGHGKFDDQNHLYAITDYKQKGTMAEQNTAVAGSVDNLHKTNRPEDSLPHNGGNVNTSAENVSPKSKPEQAPVSEGTLAALVTDIQSTADRLNGENRLSPIERGKLKKHNKDNLKRLEKMKKEGSITAKQYLEAARQLTQTNEDPEYGNIEESLENLKAQLEAGGISRDDYDAGVAELEGARAENDGVIKYSLEEPDYNILGLIERVENGEYRDNERVYLGTVPKNISEKIENILGINTSGYKIAIEARQLAHIIRDHGENGKADNSLKNKNDIAKMKYALFAPDDMSYSGKTKAYSYTDKNGKNKTSDTVLYEKRIGEKSYYVVEAVADTKAKALFIVTAFIGNQGYKRKGALQLNTAPKNRAATSENDFAITPTDSISQTPDTVNSEGKEKYSLESVSKEEMLGSLRRYMSGSISREQMRDIISRTKKNPDSEIYGGESKHPKFSEGVKNIVREAAMSGLSVRDYIGQNYDSFEKNGELSPDARAVLDIFGEDPEYSAKDKWEYKRQKYGGHFTADELFGEVVVDREFYEHKDAFDRWYEKRDKEDKMREEIAKLVIEPMSDSELDASLSELASDIENGYVTADAAAEIAEGLSAQAGKDKVKFSVEEIVNPYNESEIASIKTSSRFDVATNTDDIMEFIKSSINRYITGRTLFIGKLQDHTINKIKSDTGIDVSDYSLALHSDDLKHIIKRHGEGNENREDQLPVTTNSINDIVKTIVFPDSVSKEIDDSSGVISLVFRKNTTQGITTVTVASRKKKAIILKSAWINKKRQHISSPSDVQAPDPTSSTVGSMNTVSDGIVSHQNSDVKGKTKFSVEDNKTTEQILTEIFNSSSDDNSFQSKYLFFGKFSSDFIDILRGNGIEVKDLPIVMNYRDAYLSMQSKEKGKYKASNINYHNLGIEGMMSAINSISHPLAIIKSEKQGKIELALPFKDYKGRTGLAIVVLNTSARNADKFIEAHIVTSVYGRSNFDRYFEKALSEGRVINKKTEGSTQGIAPVQYPSDINANSSVKNSISENSEDVNPEIKFSFENNDEPIIDSQTDGPAMQNLGWLYGSQKFTSVINKTIYEQFFSPEIIGEIYSKYHISNEQEAIAVKKLASDLWRQARKTEREFELTEQDKKLALAILCGDESISEAENAKSITGVLKYVSVLGELEVMNEAFTNWRKRVRENYQKEAEDMYKIFDSSVKGGFKLDEKGNIKTDKKGNPKVVSEPTNKAGWKYNRETQERITFDIFSDEHYDKAQAFNDWLFAPERASEAESNRYKDKMRDAVRALKLSEKVKKGDAVSESAAVQLLGELQDIIRRTTRQANMGNADTYRVNGLTYSEAVQSLNDLKKQNPSMDFSPKGKIQKAVDEFTRLYAEILSDMNNALVRNGYAPVSARSGYFPHFADEGDTLVRRIGRVLGIDTDVSVLPTGVNGLTHTFKPGKTWFANALERTGNKTAYDAVLGFDKYIEGAANVIFHTDNIQRQRAFARAIRYNASDEVIKAEIDRIMADENMSEEEKDLQIQLKTKGKFRHSTYVVQLEDHTNSLAGKKTFSDRDMERLLGRKAYTWMRNIEGRVAANMIAGNLSSALSNFIPLQYCEAEIGVGYTVQAMAQTIKSFFKDDGFKDRSDFLTNRYGSEFLVQRGWLNKISSKLGIPMEAIDHFTSQTLVRAAYNKYVKKGTSPELAMKRANEWAAGVMADRSRGALPEIFNNKNPAYRAFTMFQVEVNNNLSHIMKDIPRGHRDEWACAVALILAKLFFGIWIYNELFEKLAGRRAAGTDVIDMANETVGPITGYKLPNTLDLIEAAVRGEDVGAMFITERTNIGQAALNLGKTAAEDIPFFGSLFGGGDLPVGSMLPDVANLLNSAFSDDQNKLQNIMTEALKPISYAVSPFGANQISKIAKGHATLRAGGSYKTNSAGEDILQYPVYSENGFDVAMNFIRATVFGKSSLDGAREWVENNFNSLSARATAAYKGMIAAGVPESDAYELMMELASVGPSDREIMETVVSFGGIDRTFASDANTGEPTSNQLKYAILRNADISREGKAVAFFAMLANETECELIASLQEAGADMGSVTQELLDDTMKSSDRKYSAITASGLPNDEQLRQIYQLDKSEKKSTHKRYYTAYFSFGIRPSEYRLIRRHVSEYLDGDNMTGENVEEAINEYALSVDLTKAEKGALWQIILGRDSAKNNPFDRTAGQRAAEAMADYVEKYVPKTEDE